MSKQGREMRAQAAAKKTQPLPPVPSSMTGAEAKKIVDDANSTSSKLALIIGVYDKINGFTKTIDKAITSAEKAKKDDCTNSGLKCDIAKKSLTILKNANNKNIDIKALKADLSTIHAKVIPVETALIDGIQNANTNDCEDYSVSNVSLQCDHTIMQIKADVLTADKIITQFNADYH